jgi:hypothetical protein
VGVEKLSPKTPMRPSSAGRAHAAAQNKLSISRLENYDFDSWPTSMELKGTSTGKQWELIFYHFFFLQKQGFPMVSCIFSNQSSAFHCKKHMAIAVVCCDSVTKAIVRANNHYSSQDKLTRSDPYYMRPRQGALGTWRKKQC